MNIISLFHYYDLSLIAIFVSYEILTNIPLELNDQGFVALALHLLYRANLNCYHSAMMMSGR